MKIIDGLHRLKIYFNVTEAIERFVYLYLITGKKVHIIDTGVSGAETRILDYFTDIGKDFKDIRNVLLTHAHPDHIGSAQAIKDLSNCFIYACEKERNWIENIDIQFKQRPIPNFYGLVNKSVPVDKIIKDGDILTLEDDITIKVIETKGHSQGSLSFYWLEKKVLFTGDCIPVIGDIPIFVSNRDSIDSLRKLLSIHDVNYYLSAWDSVYEKENGIANIEESLQFLLSINNTVIEVLSQNTGISEEEVYQRICHSLNLPQLIGNPLFRQSIYSNIKEVQGK